MPTLTAYREGCRTYTSLCTPHKSMAIIDVRLSGIDKADITAVTYQLGDRPSYATKTLGNGVEVTDDGLSITLDESDTRGRGKYNHYLELTDSSGTYKTILNFGRLELQ